FDCRSEAILFRGAPMLPVRGYVVPFNQNDYLARILDAGHDLPVVRALEAGFVPGMPVDSHEFIAAIGVDGDIYSLVDHDGSSSDCAHSSTAAGHLSIAHGRATGPRTTARRRR